MDKEEFRRRRAAIKAKSDKLWGDIEEHRTEEKRVIDVLHNAESILEKLDMTFEERMSQGQVIDIMTYNSYSLQYYSFWKGKIGFGFLKHEDRFLFLGPCQFTPDVTV